MESDLSPRERLVSRFRGCLMAGVAGDALGNTCLSAIREYMHGGEVHNNSKGCGGVMRVAPAGMIFAALPLTFGIVPEFCSPKAAARVAGSLAGITHKHTYGHNPCGNIGRNHQPYRFFRRHFDREMHEHIDEILEPFKEAGFDIIKISGAVDGIKSEQTYPISWDKRA